MDTYAFLPRKGPENLMFAKKKWDLPKHNLRFSLSLKMEIMVFANP